MAVLMRDDEASLGTLSPSCITILVMLTLKL